MLLYLWLPRYCICLLVCLRSCLLSVSPNLRVEGKEEGVSHATIMIDLDAWGLKTEAINDIAAIWTAGCVNVIFCTGSVRICVVVICGIGVFLPKSCPLQQPICLSMRWNKETSP